MIKGSIRTVLVGLMAIAIVACSSSGASTAPSAAAPSAAAPSAAAPSAAAPSARPQKAVHDRLLERVRDRQRLPRGAALHRQGAGAQVGPGRIRNVDQREAKRRIRSSSRSATSSRRSRVRSSSTRMVLTSSTRPSLRRSAAGIKTVALDAYVTDPNTLNISNDQVAYGYVGATWLFKQLGGKGNVYYMRGLAGHPADNDRHQGVLKALAENTRASSWSRTTMASRPAGIPTGHQAHHRPHQQRRLRRRQRHLDLGHRPADRRARSRLPARRTCRSSARTSRASSRCCSTRTAATTGLKGLAVYNPAAIGGAGLNLALKALNGETIDSKEVTVKDSNGADVKIKAIFLPTPEAYDNTTDAGMAKLTGDRCRRA